MLPKVPGFFPLGLVAFFLTTLVAGFISGDPIAFVLNLSEKLSEFAPQLTLDFIHEVSAAMTSMDKGSISHRLSCLQYMSPWIQNLSHFANATHPLFERSGARLRDCIRTLSDLSLTFPEVRFVSVSTRSLPCKLAYVLFVAYFDNPEAHLG